MSDSHILVTDKKHIRTLTINRAEKKNALTGDMYDQLTSALAEAENKSDVRVILIKGASGIFTSGNDIVDFMNTPARGPRITRAQVFDGPGGSKETHRRPSARSRHRHRHHHATSLRSRVC